MSSNSFINPLFPPPTSVGEVRARIEEITKRNDVYPDPAVWIHRLSRQSIETYLKPPAGPLFGLTFAIKDNIDLAGAPTTAACPDFSYEAMASATVVQKLVDAGAIPLGKTNLDQFATGLVGTRSPYGATRNPYNPAYISGGSSSGSAVAVSAGLVDFALGTDTAGSGRVPASFCNLVGFKPTRGQLSLTGVVPACRSLDCVSIFTRTVDLAAKVFSVARGFDKTDIYSRPFTQSRATLRGFTFGIPREEQLEFFGDAEGKSHFIRAVKRAQSIGGVPMEIDFSLFTQVAQLLYDGPWVAERLFACKSLLERSPDSFHPVTRAILGKAKSLSALSVFEAQYKLIELQRAIAPVWNDIDVLLLPTAGRIHTHAEIEADPIRLNTNLGHYTNFANLLDLCAIALPNGFTSRDLPTGITFFAPAGFDEGLLELGRQWETSTAGVSPVSSK